jgi:hypothetical protein
MHLVGYLYEDYHVARSLEHKVRITNFVGLGPFENVQFIKLPTVLQHFIAYEGSFWN